MVHKPQLYLETSIFGFAYDRHPGNVFRRQAVKRLFEQVAAGVFIAVTAPLTVRELNRTAPPLREALLRLVEAVRFLELPDQDVERLAALYVSEGIIPGDFDDDARHVASAVLSSSDVVVSLNLKHLANEWAERRLNAINLREGFRLLSIRTPEEVVNYEE